MVHKDGNFSEHTTTAEEQPTKRKLWPFVVGGFALLGICMCACISLAIVAYFVEDDNDTGERQASEQLFGEQPQTILLPASGGGDPFQADIVNGIARTASGETVLPDSVANDPAAQARAYLDLYADLYPLPVGATLTTDSVLEVTEGRTAVTLGFRVNDVHVDGAEIIVQISPNNSVSWATASYPLSVDVDTRPQLTAEEAAMIALEAGEELDGSEMAIVINPQLIIHNPGLYANHISDSVLAWDVTVASDLVEATVIVNAQTGEVVDLWDDTDPLDDGDPAYSIFTINNNNYKGPGITREHIENIRVLLMTEAGGAPGAAPDAVAANISGFIQQVLAYYQNTFARESYDGAGTRVNVHIHAGPQNHRNARWSEHMGGMFIGDLVDDFDTVAHEFTHGVVRKTIGLDAYDNSQAGALSESLADIFAAFITDDWVMGEEGAANPRNLTQERTIANFVVTSERDKHKNSMIPSHAAYLITDNSAASANQRRVVSQDGEEIIWNGIGKAKAQQIYYRVLADHMLTPTASFSDLRGALRDACRKLVDEKRFGVVVQDCGVILNAFAKIGVGSVDSDFDSVPDFNMGGNVLDNCRNKANRFQENDDGDGEGDACEDWVIAKVEAQWRTVTDMCNVDNPPTTAVQNQRTTYYFGKRGDLETYVESTNTDVQLGVWNNTLGDQWEHFAVSRADVIQVADKDAGIVQVDAIKSANPSGRDDIDDEYEVWTVWTAVDQPLSESEKREVCGDDDLLADESDPVWVLVDTQINPGQYPLQDTGKADFNSAYDGSIDSWAVSETSMTANKRTIYNDDPLVDATTTVQFDAPPDELIPGETIRLQASGNMSVSAAQQIPFEQFQYEVNENQVSSSYFQLTPDNPSESTSIEISIPSGQPDAQLTIAAGLWNCSACNVYWIYEWSE
jgi:Zn-dependent metalloprotease